MPKGSTRVGIQNRSVVSAAGIEFRRLDFADYFAVFKHKLGACADDRQAGGGMFLSNELESLDQRRAALRAPMNSYEKDVLMSVGFFLRRRFGHFHIIAA